jgi:dihydroorotase
MNTPAPADAFIIRGARLIDPARNVDAIEDIAIGSDGLIARHSTAGAPSIDAAPIIDAAGLIVCPGLIDIHVHLREPGGEHKETIESGTRAAAAGGFTSVACMPNTKPPIDNAETLTYVREKAAEFGYCRVFPLATITKGRAGSTIVNMTDLKRRGAIAFSDDGDGVENDDVMREAFIQAKKLNAVLVQHCEYKALSAGGVMHKGEVSQRLNLPGLDPRCEEAMIERDINLVRETGARYHIAHISTAIAVDLVRAAKAEGLPVTTEVCVHHLLLTDEACADADPNTKMHPPLRPAHDVAACVEGLNDGTIDCLVTDHAPHAADEKSLGMIKAPPGIVGLETSFGLSANLFCHSDADWRRLIRWMTAAPARVLDLPVGYLPPGAPADITLIDPNAVGRVDPAQFQSKCKNSPFAGAPTRGRVVATWVGGRLIFTDSADSSRFAALRPPLVHN